MAIVDQVCSDLEVPMAEHKRDGPTTCLTFLVIDVDMSAGQLHLPRDKTPALGGSIEELGGPQGMLMQGTRVTRWPA